MILAISNSPLLLFGNSGSLPAAPNPVLKRTGAQVDGGLNCTACHQTYAPANSDNRGRVVVESAYYKPGQKQIVRVRVEHPEAQRWGFQLTARTASDETKTAGSFTSSASVRVECDDGSLRGSLPPCAEGTLQFANHTMESTRNGTPGGVWWDIEWTPPATDVGDVVFYAAGNAANGNGTNVGDRIYTTALRVGGCSTAVKPSIRGVVNAATYQPGVALNTIVSIFGAGFAGAGQMRAAGIGDFDHGNFPKELACMAVEINGQRAPVVYVQGDQINAQVPTMPVSGPVEMRVLANPGAPNQMASDPATIQMQNHAPALFTFGSSNSVAAVVPGTGQPIANPDVIQNGRPARPGEIIELYGTGFGVTEPVYQAGERPPEGTRIRDPFTVTIGGTTLRAEDVIYGGIAPTSISGLFQFNVRLPESMADGDLPVVIRIGGLETQNGVIIPVKR